MALINCPECKQNVSEKAASCPKCGYGIAVNIKEIKARSKKEKKDALSGCLIIFVGIIVAIMYFLPSDEQKEEKARLKVQEKNKQEQVLYEKVKKIPASKYNENRDGYEKLMELNPNSKLYKEKFKYYETLSKKEEESSRNEQNIQTNSSSTLNSNDSRSKYIDDLRILQANGAFTIDRTRKVVFVETGFWSAMDYRQKEGFCFMVRETYPMYSAKILDKYTGTVLAEMNLFGELNLVR